MGENASEISGNVGITPVPDIPQKDRKGLWIFGESESKRRIIVVEKINGSYGFTLQSYGLRYKHGRRETDFITYVNAVEKDGASYFAGLREGDVILSINGQNMARVEHKSLVSFIRNSPASLKMVVVSDERARKVELHMRYVHLQKKLQDKMKELDDLNWKEKMILTGVYRQNPSGPAALGDIIGVSSTGTSSRGKITGAGTAGEASKTSACCFCPQQRPSSNSGNNMLLQQPSLTSTNPNPKSCIATKSDTQTSQNSQTQTVQIVRISNTEKKQRSKSVKVFDKQTGSSSYYDCYRKCQSTRELSSATAASRSRNNSISAGDKEEATSALPTPALSNNKSQPGQRSTASASNSSNDRETFGIGVKPKSWDNVMLGSSTKSFGGYGYGFGYGYFPSKDNCNEAHSSGARGLNSSHHYHHHVTHPHHHNHHSHCTHTHAHPEGNYYYSGAGASGKSYHHQQSQHRITPSNSLDNGMTATSQAPNLKHFYKHNAIVNPYQYQGTITSTSTSIGIEAVTAKLNETEISSYFTRSKTLPSSARKPSSSRTTPTQDRQDPFTAPKMEKTLSDSSLNSEHHKEFPKTMSYFKRSGDNVRFSSDEEFYGSNFGRNVATPTEREHIFV